MHSIESWCSSVQGCRGRSSGAHVNKNKGLHNKKRFYINFTIFKLATPLTVAGLGHVVTKHLWVYNKTYKKVVIYEYSIFLEVLLTVSLVDLK